MIRESVKAPKGGRKVLQSLGQFEKPSRASREQGAPRAGTAADMECREGFRARSNAAIGSRNRFFNVPFTCRELGSLGVPRRRQDKTRQDKTINSFAVQATKNARRGMNLGTKIRR